MSKLRCKCGAIAVWFYMPDSDRTLEERAFCDDCVPRGCSCNEVPIDGNWDSEDPTNYEQELDDDGREFPCCEYWYDPEGWDI